MTHAPSTGIEDLYRSVIDETLTSSQDAFNDEHVDVEIIKELKRVWMDKINETGAADLNAKPTTSIPATRPVSKPLNGPRPTASNSSIATNPPPPPPPPVVQSVPLVVPNPPPIVQNPPAPVPVPEPIVQNVAPLVINPPTIVSNASAIIPNGTVIFRHPIDSVPQEPPISRHGGISNMPYFPSQTNGQQLVINGLNQNVVFVSAPNLNDPITQLDGGNMIPNLENAIVEIDYDSNTLTIDASCDTKLADYMHRVNNARTEKQLKKRGKKRVKRIILDEASAKKIAILIPQIDGGPEMSDSDSEEEEEEDPLSNIGEIEQPAGDVEAEPGDEAPLNSGDDQSDDEDLDTLFESNNIIVCQFEKVNRARNKWKFTLKDGIMHLDGKDYCFQKCGGEAEW